MKQYKFIGLFKNQLHEYRLEVNAFNFIQAFFLLTSKALELGNHYQLYSITDEKQKTIYVNKISDMNIFIEDNCLKTKSVEIDYEFNFNNISNGSIIRFKNTGVEWICIHYTNCNMKNRAKHNKYDKNHTGYYLFRGRWYEGNPLTDEPYGICAERLERGMFNNIEYIGHINKL